MCDTDSQEYIEHVNDLDCSKNFFNVSLGPNILKADTAVIAALSLTFHYFS